MLRWLFFWTLLGTCQGQRAVVSLGSKPKDAHGASTSNKHHRKLQEAPINHGEPVDLSFEGIEFIIGDRTILDGSIRGRAQPGRLMAIMGPSGAGKSSVLAALARRINASSKIILRGRRWSNGKRLKGRDALPAAWIPQESEGFFPQMTVRETMDFRVRLQYSHLSQEDRKAMVDDTLDKVGLLHVANTKVGNAKVKGLSGGERKRLSIAVELLASPSLLFLDEPTSGLDATSATKLVHNLRELAKDRTVVAVIHQPSQHVFDLFDDLLLVSEGKQLYFGERKMARKYFEQHGCPASPEVGTAEHVLDCITRDVIFAGETEEKVDQRMESLIAAASAATVKLGVDDKSSSAVSSSSSSTSVLRPKASLLTQFRLLFQRSLRQLFRGRFLLAIKVIQQVTIATIYGGIYSLGNNQASIQDRFGLLSLIAIGAANMALASSIRSFPKEKAIITNELASSLYSSAPYFIGKVLSELPLVTFMSSLFGTVVYYLTGMNRGVGKFANFLKILALHGLTAEATGMGIGAISPNSDVALALFPAILVINIIFDGKNISEENTPRLLRWVPKLGLIRWGFEGLCVNEFEGLEFTSGGPRRGPVAKTGADALARFGLGGRSLGEIFRAQILIAGSLNLLSFFGLTLAKQRYQVMEDSLEHKP